MPNNPLKTFRSVEPANYGFGSSATLASRPFVLYHQTKDETLNATAGVVTAVTFATTHVAKTSKSIPWIIKDADQVYPVAVPNAYDRLYVFPMYVVEQGVSKTSTNYVHLGLNEAGGSLYVPPIVFPFGRFPETAGLTTANKLNETQYRIPDDLISANPLSSSSTTNLNTRANGLWTVLPPYGTNFTTSNKQNIVVSSTDPSSVARIHVANTTSLVGNAYKLPPDLSISPTMAAALTTVTTAALGVAGYSAAFLDVASTGNPFPADQEGVVIGQGIEYQTMGCDLIVVSPQSLPDKIHVAPRGTTAGTSVRVHWFLMGVFLG
jgi:hypothetical protein